MSLSGAKRCKMSADDGAGAGDRKRPKKELLVKQEDDEAKGEEDDCATAYSWQAFYEINDQFSQLFPGDSEVDVEKRWSKRVDTFSDDEEVKSAAVNLYPTEIMQPHKDYWSADDFPFDALPSVETLEDFKSIGIGRNFYRYYEGADANDAWPIGYYLCEKR